MRLPLVSALLGACALLPAQGVFLNADKPSDSICPMNEVDRTLLEFGAPNLDPADRSLGQGGEPMDEGVPPPIFSADAATAGKVGAARLNVASHQRFSQLYPKEQRKDVSHFTAYDEKGKPTSIASLKGQLVLVALWSHRCEPSAKLIMELASIYPNRDKFNFAVLAINFDTSRRDINNGIPGGWQAIKLFEIRNREVLDKAKVPFYIPGVGEEGVNQMYEPVKSVPVLMVVDGEGKLASVDIGYEPNIVAKRLSLFIREAKGELKIQAPGAAPAPTAPTEPSSK